MVNAFFAVAAIYSTLVTIHVIGKALWWLVCWPFRGVAHWQPSRVQLEPRMQPVPTLYHGEILEPDRGFYRCHLVTRPALRGPAVLRLRGPVPLIANRGDRWLRSG
jgi:hypothetical protein